MTHMFDNFNKSQYEIPDNRKQVCGKDETDEIVIGGTCYHVFKIPCKYRDNVLDGKILYYNQLKTIIEKEINADDVIEGEDYSWIRIKLTSEETNLFNSRFQAFSQVKLVLKNQDIIYLDKVEIKIIDTIQEIKLEEN